MPVPSGPWNHFLAITKSDTDNFSQTPCGAIYVGGAGIVVAVMPNGETANFTAVAGEILPVAAVRVNSSTTTATLMVACYQV